MIDVHELVHLQKSSFHAEEEVSVMETWSMTKRRTHGIERMTLSQ